MEPKDSQPSQPPSTETKPAFVIGGVNETSVIRNLTEINRISITQLEEAMRDDWKPEDLSEFLKQFQNIPPNHQNAFDSWYDSIFLGPDESLLDVLATDNDTVLGLGLTHQQLADFLDLFRIYRNPEGRLEFNGKTYQDERVGWPGGAMSPFQDGIYTNIDHHLTRIEDGAQFRFSGLLPELIRRYGFYEGHRTAYRVDPRELAEFAGLIVKQDK